MHPSAQKVFQLKITLAGIQPTIWRTVLVPSNCTLEDLHYIIQDALGWSNSHLHEFRTGKTAYSDPSFDLDDAEDEGEISLNTVFPKVKSKIAYQYDMGDSWDHEVVLMGVLDMEKGKKYPTCIGGENACPPEDCGGTHGYAEFKKTMANPNHPEHAAMREWYGGPFDPEVFDLVKVTKRIESGFCRKQTEKARGDGPDDF